MHADNERQLAEDFVLTEGDGIEECKENTEDGDGDDFVEMELKAWKVYNVIHNIPSLYAVYWNTFPPINVSVFNTVTLCLKVFKSL